jgi:pimeloyl-ACP methyl ester carboxylesterase
VVNAAVPSGWRTGRVRAAGISLATYEAGSDASDAPAVLLLHGLGHWTDGAWGRLVPLLDPKLRCVAFDLPGFGASDKPDVRYDRVFFRQVVDEAAGALGLGSVVLVGHSLGGFIAADWAGAHPDRVTRLALVAPAGFSRTPRHLIFALLASGPGRFVFTGSPSRRFVERALLRAVADPATLDPAHIDHAVDLAQDLAMRKAFGGVYSAAVTTFAGRRTMHADFARYAGPVFCAWGKHDRYIHATSLRDVVRVYPRAQTLLLDRSGHLPMIEQPAELAAALNVFFAS